MAIDQFSNSKNFKSGWIARRREINDIGIFLHFSPNNEGKFEVGNPSDIVGAVCKDIDVSVLGWIVRDPSKNEE